MIEDTEIRAFLQAEYPRLVNAVAFVTGDLGAAEDAVQEALVRAWIRSERGEEIDSLTAWVATVALNLTRSRWRRLLTERRFATRQVRLVSRSKIVARITLTSGSPSPSSLADSARSPSFGTSCR